MLKSVKKWDVIEVEERLVNELAQEVPCSPLLARLLYNRGFKTSTTARQFLHSENVPYHDPYLMLGMEVVVERVSLAIENEEKILVFGDYDADGVTSTSVLVLALRELGAIVSYYIPDRFKEGYGPNIPAIENAINKGVSLVITVDTGISAVEVASYAASAGLDYIVTDHHEPPPVLPEAYAILNPKQPGCPYPFKGLSGVGVAIKLVQALFDDIPTHLLDLAAVGTISDLVPLEGENRRLVKEGLYVLSTQPKPGLKALLQVVGHAEHQPVDSELVGFQLGPRLNAAGRLQHASLAANLLMSETLKDAIGLAESLNQLNQERKAFVEQTALEAIAMVEQFSVEDRDFIIVANPGWHEGVLGIVASRLVETFYRPTLVLSIHPETGMAKGSARSIEGFDVFQALSTCRDLLPHFGGHEMAAGLSLPADSVDELRERMNRFARQLFTDEMLVPKVKVEAEVRVPDISVDWIEELTILEPFGEGNPKPLFLVEKVKLMDLKQIGSDKSHLKMQLGDGNEVLDAISFRNGHLAKQMTPNAQLSVIGKFGVNEWNGFRKPQLFVEDFLITDWQLFDYRGSSHWKTVLKEVLEERDAHAVYFQSNPLPQLTNALDSVTYLTNGLASTSLILMDMPESMDQLDHFFQSIRFSGRLYLVFDQNTEASFNTVPSRDQFKQVFSLFYKHTTITVQKLRQWAQFKKWSRTHMDFIIKVFLELEFVKMEQDVLKLVPNSEKKPLTDSKSYQARLMQTDVEELLLYSSKQTLKEWLSDRISKGQAAKEDVLS